MLFLSILFGWKIWVANQNAWKNSKAKNLRCKIFIGLGPVQFDPPTEMTKHF